MRYEFVIALNHFLFQFSKEMPESEQKLLDFFTYDFPIKPGTLKLIPEDNYLIESSLGNENDWIVVEFYSDKKAKLYLEGIKLYIDGYFYIIDSISEVTNIDDPNEKVVSCLVSCFDHDAVEYVVPRKNELKHLDEKIFTSKGIVPDAYFRERFKWDQKGTKPLQFLIDKAKRKIAEEQGEIKKEPKLDDRTSFEDISMLRKAFEDMDKGYQHPETDPNEQTYESNIRKVL